MSPSAEFSLLFVMLALAAVPSASVALVVTRSATQGLRNGIAVAFGIVLGDLVFGALAIFGLSVLTETMGAFLAVVRYAGEAYLIWMGVILFRMRREATVMSADDRKSTLTTSLVSGFVLTLGDVKTILFYASLFPTFVDVASLSGVDIAAIVIITVRAEGGVKLAYAFVAQRIVERLRMRQNQNREPIRMAAGGLLVGTGPYLIAKA